VSQRLPCLHDPDDGSLDEVLPILVDVLHDLSGFGLLLGLHRLVEVDSDLARVERKRRGQVWIERTMKRIAERTNLLRLVVCENEGRNVSR